MFIKKLILLIQTMMLFVLLSIFWTHLADKEIYQPFVSIAGIFCLCFTFPVIYNKHKTYYFTKKQ